MLPGTHNDQRKNARVKRPPCGIRGFAAAWSVLECVDRDDHRDLLTRLTREGGFQGAPAMKWMALCLCREAGLRMPESPPDALATFHVEMIGERAARMLDPYRALFPLAVKPRG